MSRSFLIGLDYGTQSARGVLVDARTGEQIDSHAQDYRHGVMTRALADGTTLPNAWALQDGQDYLEAAEAILKRLGEGRDIEAIGIGFTASSPMPTTAAGEALSTLRPGDPHAYVKLWKHGAAQPYANRINGEGGAFLDNFGGKLSGEWLLAKAAQIAGEAPETWARTERFIEAGDWLVWRLTGVEARGAGMAGHKAQYRKGHGYPEGVVEGLAERLSAPLPVGSAAGSLCARWRARTGIRGRAVVAVCVIDSHVVLPAVGAVSDGCLVGALGTSAAYLVLTEDFHALPPGIEGTAFDGSVRGLWCYEAGQASFGDTLQWFVKSFPRGASEAESFAAYNKEAEALAPGRRRLLAVDWLNGNRVPYADSGLSGIVLGLRPDTTASEIYRALMESLCFGTRSIVDLFEGGGLAVRRIVMTSGLASHNELLVQIMADVLGRDVEVPAIGHPTAVGAAIHGAVAAGLVEDYAQGARRYGASEVRTFRPRPAEAAAYGALFESYRRICANAALREVLGELNPIDAAEPRPGARSRDAARTPPPEGLRGVA